MLRLDRVWWLVSPQNPLKPSAGMASLEDRMATARRVAAHSRIMVTDIERVIRTRYTVDTLRKLTERFPQVRFVWIMGADNMVQIPQWRDWPGLFRTIPVAIIDRPTYAQAALAARATRRFARFRVPEKALAGLPDRPPPAWAFVRPRLHAASATRIRQSGAWPRDTTGGIAPRATP